MSKKFQGRRVLPRAAEADQRRLGGAHRPQDQAQLQGLVMSAFQEDQRDVEDAAVLCTRFRLSSVFQNIAEKLVSPNKCFPTYILFPFHSAHNIAEKFLP